MRWAALLALLVAGPALAAQAPAPAPVTLTVYSDRHQEEDGVLFDGFAKETGIAVTLVDDEPEVLLQRLADEGAKSPADLLLWVGATEIEQAADAGTLRPIASDAAIGAVPAWLHDAKRRWVGLAWWARGIAYRSDRFAADDVARYEDLADPRFQGQLLVRSAMSPYNMALMATIVAADGGEEAETWGRGLVANLARPPQGGDTDQIDGLYDGVGGVALVNTPYWGRYAASDKVTEHERLDGLALALPNQMDRGAMVDIVAAAVPKAAPHPKAAERLIEYLLRADMQEKLAKAGFDYPARAGVPAAATLPDPAGFKIDSAGLAKLGTIAPEAEQAIAKAGWE